MQCVDELQMLIVSCDKTQNIFCLKLPKVFVYYQNVTVNGRISVKQCQELFKFSMYTYCRNKSTCCLTYNNFITEDRMPRNTYLFENRMFTNKVKHSII